MRDSFGYRSVAAAVLGVVLLGTAVEASAVQAGSPAPSTSRFIVTLDGSDSIALPGVKVVATLPAIHAAVVNATSDGHAALLRDPRVQGVSPDTQGRLAGNDSELAALESAVKAAEKGVDAARRDVDKGTDELAKAQRKAADADADVIKAEAEVAQAQSDKAGKADKVDKALRKLADARADAADAAAKVTAARAVLLAAQSALGAATRGLDEARARLDEWKKAEQTPTGTFVAQAIGGPAGLPGSGRGVTVALLDTGVSDSAALDRRSGRLVDAVDTSGLSHDKGKIVEKGVFSDGFGHGTFMASLIAGGPVEGSGTRGVGVAPAATVAVVKVADNSGETSLSAVLAGLNWVATHADTVAVANLSLSVDRPSELYGIDPLNYAVELTRAQGVTVVVAAGNVAGAVSDPGFAPAALTVGAADTTNRAPTVAAFSGSAVVAGVLKPDVVAPGVDVLGIVPSGSVVARAYPNAKQPGGLFRGSGTSQSTAVVSGIAAIVKQNNPRATPQQVKSSIRDAAVRIVSGSDRLGGSGLVTVPFQLTGTNTGESALDRDLWLVTRDEWGDVWNLDLWSARTWSARTWSARTWSSDAWSARTWSARTWSARTWSARTWSARTWSTHAWGDLQ